MLGAFDAEESYPALVNPHILNLTIASKLLVMNILQI